MSLPIEEIFAQVPMPPSARLLGLKFVAFDPETKALTLDFEAREEFLNPLGVVQGGIIAAMLDDTMGPTIVAASGGKAFSTSIDMNVSFLAPARLGRLRCVGRVIRLGRTVAFLEAEMFDEAGEMLARATSSARIVETPFDMFKR